MLLAEVSRAYALCPSQDVECARLLSHSRICHPLHTLLQGRAFYTSTTAAVVSVFESIIEHNILNLFSILLTSLPKLERHHDASSA